MRFEELLRKAQKGDVKALEEVFMMYRPLLIKNSMDNNVFDEDLSRSFPQHSFNVLGSLKFSAKILVRCVVI